jgi:hypothetical protein
MGAATFVHSQRLKDILSLDASAYRVVLLSPLDVMEKARDDRRGKERFDHGLADAQSAALNQDNGPRIPCYGLAVTEPVCALQLRFVKIGAAFPDEIVGLEDLLGAVYGSGMLAIERGSWQGPGHLDSCVLKPLICRPGHVPIINTLREACQGEFFASACSD